MDKNKSNWKDHLLKSGLPLEFEVKRFLDDKGCISNMERTYLRNNEAEIPTEFSYDIDSSYIKGHHFSDLMIECKYRHESTKWIFLPDDYNSVDDIAKTDFMHPFDHFNRQKSGQLDFPLSFGPLCTKGVELTSDGPNPKTITQAVAQLSYAMAEKITSAIYHQTDSVLGQHFNGTIFYNIPVIVTTAQLYRLREDIDIETIRLAENIEDVAINLPYLVMKAKPGTDLEMFNNRKFREFVIETGVEDIKKQLNSFNDDLWFVLSNIAEHKCPNSIVVINHSKDASGLIDFFKFIDRVIKPDQEIMDLIKKKEKEMKKFLDKFNPNKVKTEVTPSPVKNESEQL